MQLIRQLFFALFVVILLALVVALFVPKTFDVERSITINKHVEVVFDYIKFLKNQDNFSKWAKMDPEMKKSYRGEDGTVGFISAWDSNQKDVGKGEQEIVQITENQRINYELRFIKPYETTNQAYILTNQSDENQTLVTWGISGSMDYPMNLMLLFWNMDELVGNDLKIGLDNLKSILEE